VSFTDSVAPRPFDDWVEGRERVRRAVGRLAADARDFAPREFEAFARLLADDALDFAPREFEGFAPLFFCGLERFV
jgi:hypothetical protein